MHKRWSTLHGFFCWSIFIKLVFICTKKVNWMSFWRILIFWDFSGIDCLVYSWENLISLIFPLGTEQILQSRNPGKTGMKLFIYKNLPWKKSPQRRRLASSFNIIIISLNTEHNHINIDVSLKISFN